MAEDSPNELLVMGCAYTPRFGDDKTTLFNHGEMNQEFADRIKGLPVHIEHQTDKTIGEVKEAFINERRQLMTLLHLSGDPVVNSKLPEKLFRGTGADDRRFYNGLSLGNGVGFEVKRHPGGYTTKEVVGNAPTEVSVVREGNRPMTEIVDYWVLPKSANVDDYIRENINPFIVRHH